MSTTREELGDEEIFAEDLGPDGLGFGEVLGAGTPRGDAIVDALDEEVPHHGGVGLGAFLDIFEGLFEGVLEIEAGEKKDECQHQNDGGDVEAGLEREPVGEGHCVTAF